jgi:hypothetical protein
MEHFPYNAQTTCEKLINPRSCLQITEPNHTQLAQSQDIISKLQRFKHLGQHFMKLSDSKDISVSRVLQSVGLLNMRI